MNGNFGRAPAFGVMPSSMAMQDQMRSVFGMNYAGVLGAPGGQTKFQNQVGDKLQSALVSPETGAKLDTMIAAQGGAMAVLQASQNAQWWNGTEGTAIVLGGAAAVGALAGLIAGGTRGAAFGAALGLAAAGAYRLVK